MPISSPNPTSDQLLEASYWDNSNKWSNIRFGEEIRQLASVAFNLRVLVVALLIDFVAANRDTDSFCRFRAQDKVFFIISKIPFSSPNPIFDHLLESSLRDDSNKWSNIGFGKE